MVVASDLLKRRSREQHDDRQEALLTSMLFPQITAVCKRYNVQEQA